MGVWGFDRGLGAGLFLPMWPFAVEMVVQSTVEGLGASKGGGEKQLGLETYVQAMQMSSLRTFSRIC